MADTHYILTGGAFGKNSHLLWFLRQKWGLIEPWEILSGLKALSSLLNHKCNWSFKNRCSSSEAECFSPWWREESGKYWWHLWWSTKNVLRRRLLEKKFFWNLDKSSMYLIGLTDSSKGVKLTSHYLKTNWKLSCVCVYYKVAFVWK